MKHFRVTIITGAGSIPVHLQAYNEDNVTEVCASMFSGNYGSDWLIESITEVNPQIDQEKAISAFLLLLGKHKWYN